MVMSTGKPGASLTTLWTAHQMLSAARPAKDAARKEWLGYYRQSARIYAEVAEIDRGHHHEALYWAARMERKAAELQEQRDSSKQGTEPTGAESLETDTDKTAKS